MIRFLADVHGGKDASGLEKYLKTREDGDLLIILGDMELHFGDSEENRAFSAWFETLDAPIAFLDGNHENFTYLNGLPVEERYGGKVHRLSDNIVHLMRGEIYTIEGKTFFVMGGCASSQKWKDLGLWWPEESPDREEIANAYENLKKHGDRVDYILTHTPKANVPSDDPYSLDGLFRYLAAEVDYKRWYAGHLHFSGEMDGRRTVVYTEPVALKEP